MTSSLRRVIVGLCAWAGLVVPFGEGAHAEPLTVAAGEVVLPLSGFAIELPPALGATYRLSGRYRLQGAGEYQASDRVDLVEAEGRTTTRLEIQHGQLATSCAESLRRDLPEGAQVVPATLFGEAASLRTHPAERRATACFSTRSEALIVALETLDAPATHEGLAMALAQSAIAERVVEAYRVGRVRLVAPLASPHVERAEGSGAAPTSLRLTRLMSELRLPADGLAWFTDRELGAETRGDFIASIFPSAADLGIELWQDAGPCEEGWSRTSGEVEDAVAVGRWTGELVTQRGASGTFHEAWLCRREADRVLLARVTCKAELGAFLPSLEPALASIAEVLRALPSPDRRHRPRPQGEGRAFFAGFAGFELPFSSRDTGGRPSAQFPAERVIGPGFSMDFTWLADHLLGRMRLAATVDFGSLFDDSPSSAARWGAHHMEAAFELGAGLGEDLIVGVTAGWTGLSGPLTLNSSLSVSAIVAMPPAHDSLSELGWILRVTPVQLLASNERWLLSPLSVDLSLAFDTLGFGVEVQWIGPPEPGDEDLPAEGWAAILRFGTGLMQRSR